VVTGNHKKIVYEGVLWNHVAHDQIQKWVLQTR